MSQILEVKVLKQNAIVPGCYRLDLAAPAIAGTAAPGQFLHVRCGDTLDPLLRRPFSIHAVDRERGTVALLYRVVGRGTALLAQKQKDDPVSLLGPLGSGFTMPGSGEKILVLAGGIGVAPLYFLLQELSRLNHRAAVFLGAPTGKQLLCARAIKALGHGVVTATDDGSEGFAGTVTALWEHLLHSRGDAERATIPDRVYGCGPRGMLKNLCALLKERGIPGEVSLEERMGCGVGACLSCACRTLDGEGGIRYRRACVEGPVFPAGEVVWS